MLLAGRHIYGKSHVDLIVETFLDLPEQPSAFGRSGEMDSWSTNVTVDIFYAKNKMKITVYQ
jgi:hypothetical protein